MDACLMKRGDTAVALSSSLLVDTPTEEGEDVLLSHRVSFKGIKIGDVMYQGCTTEVFSGFYESQRIAIKKLKKDKHHDGFLVSSFHNEAKLMLKLAHPCVLQLIGVAWDVNYSLLVLSEFMEGRDLGTVLALEQGHPPLKIRHRFPCCNAVKLQIADKVAQALRYLHALTPPVVYGNLNTRKVLLSEDLTQVKLSGVGPPYSCKYIHDSKAPIWIAPEILKGESYNEKADVYSFGVLLSEFHVLALPEVKGTVSCAAELYFIADSMINLVCHRMYVHFETEMIARFGLRCIALDPADRPTIEEVISELQRYCRGKIA